MFTGFSWVEWVSKPVESIVCYMKGHLRVGLAGIRFCEEREDFHHGSSPELYTVNPRFIVKGLNPVWEIFDEKTNKNHFMRAWKLSRSLEFLTTISYKLSFFRIFISMADTIFL